MRGTTVRKIAESVIRSNRRHYSNDLLSLVPEDLMAIRLSTETHAQVSAEIDSRALLPKQDEMAKLLGLSNDWYKTPAEREQWDQVISSDLGSLPPEQETKRREIKFLSSLSATVMRQ